MRHGREYADLATSKSDVLPYIAAIALAGAAAWFSIRGTVVLFPGSPMAIIAMACAMEAAKLVTAGWLARRWRATAWIWRLLLVPWWPGWQSSTQPACTDGLGIVYGEAMPSPITLCFIALGLIWTGVVLLSWFDHLPEW